MGDALVVDASAAIAMLRGESEARAVAAALAGRAGSGDVFVPDHFWLEVENVLVRRYRWGADAVVEAFRLLDDAGLQTTAVDRPIVLLSLQHMTASGLTAYDAAYVALAEAQDAMLLTLDGELAAAAPGRAIAPGRHRTRDSGARYGTLAGTAPSWAIHGRYLADLRGRTATS